MKYLKTYEFKSVVMPKVGDYVICDVSRYTSDKEFIDFISNSIGKIKEIEYSNDSIDYFIKYKNIPTDKIEDWFPDNDILFASYSKIYKENDIKHWSKDKEELKALLSSNKYNL